jgi:hypothetical protein
VRTSRTTTKKDAAIASPTIPTIARTETPPEVSVRASQPSPGVSPLPSASTSPLASESGVVSLQRETDILPVASTRYFRPAEKEYPQTVPWLCVVSSRVSRLGPFHASETRKDTLSTPPNRPSDSS